jgi:hypothetical protein
VTTTLLFLALVAGSPGESDADVLANAERAFSEGTELRGDSEMARPAFARAAAAYDELWRRGFRNPALALNRGRAKRLAGDLGGAIAAYHDGLAFARYDRPLQTDLADARAAVAFPHDGELAAQCRPKVSRTISTRMSPLDAFLIAGALWLMACGGLARFAMTRAGWWLAFTGGSAAALTMLGALWWEDSRQRERYESRPLVVVREDVSLRKGNTELHPPRLDQKLPRGVEARELLRRGGWVQVELAAGAIGWLPETSVVPSP